MTAADTATPAEADDEATDEPRSAAGERPHAAGDRLSPTGRRVRLAATVVGGLLLLAGTFWGTDDHFPFGPFKMYANANDINGLVRSARVEAVNVDGERFKLTDASTGMRRAEIEGQIPRFREDGDRLEAVADAYEARHPDAPQLVLVEILQRRYHLQDGQPSGEVTEVQVAAWAAPGYAELADYDARIAAEQAEEEARLDAASTGDASEPSDDAARSEPDAAADGEPGDGAAADREPDTAGEPGDGATADREPDTAAEPGDGATAEREPDAAEADEGAAARREPDAGGDEGGSGR